MVDFKEANKDHLICKVHTNLSFVQHAKTVHVFSRLVDNSILLQDKMTMMMKTQLAMTHRKPKSILEKY